MAASPFSSSTGDDHQSVTSYIITFSSSKQPQQQPPYSISAEASSCVDHHHSTTPSRGIIVPSSTLQPSTIKISAESSSGISSDYQFDSSIFPPIPPASTTAHQPKVWKKMSQK
ncbi:hypothetical protein HDU76_010770, partial [Blyttiomyces sp. JEL0837]